MTRNAVDVLVGRNNNTTPIKKEVSVVYSNTMRTHTKVLIIMKLFMVIIMIVVTTLTILIKQNVPNSKHFNGSPMFNSC